MSDRRKVKRLRCLLGARVIFNNRASTMSCTLRNQSDEGCLLIFGETPYIPDEFEIVLDNRKTLMPAQAVWRDNEKVGVVFPRGRFFDEMREETEKSIALNGLARPGTSLH